MLLRESFREDGKVKKRTLANLSKLPDDVVDGLRILLKGGVALKSFGDAFEILRSRPHGHVVAVLGTARALGLEKLLDRRPSRMRSLAMAMIASRVLDPRSKLATARGLGSETQADTLARSSASRTLAKTSSTGPWTGCSGARSASSGTLAARHIEDGSLVLCDLTSVYFEGAKCPLAKRGYSRDGKRGKLQIVFALLCDREGRPVAAEVFEGNTADPGAVASQVEKLRRRFSLSRIVLAGDRGLLTDRPHPRGPLSGGAAVDHRAQGPEDPQAVGRWRLAAVALRRAGPGGDLRAGLYPGERLIVCRNPLLARRAGPQARGAAGGHGGQARPGRPGHDAREPAAAGREEHRRARRPGPARPQGRQALHHHRERGRLLVGA